MHSRYTLCVAVLTAFFLASAPAAQGQTTYSSPVKVTNPTTSPVPVATQGTVTVAPVGGTMRVGVEGAVTVTAPNNAPVPVKIGDTVAVAQQGTVTVTPSGGEMRVTPAGGEMRVVPAGTNMPVSVSNSVTVVPSGGAMTVAPSGGTMPVSGTLTVSPSTGTMPVSGTVTLSGAPQISFNPEANGVRLAGAPFFKLVTASLQQGETGMQTGEVLAPSPSGYELDSVSLKCRVAASSTLVSVEVVMSRPGYPMGFVFIPMVRQGHNPTIPADVWVGSLPNKLTVPADHNLSVQLTRYTNDQYASCDISIAARTLD